MDKKRVGKKGDHNKDTKDGAGRLTTQKPLSGFSWLLRLLELRRLHWLWLLRLVDLLVNQLAVGLQLLLLFLQHLDLLQELISHLLMLAEQIGLSFL